MPRWPWEVGDYHLDEYGEFDKGRDGSEGRHDVPANPPANWAPGMKVSGDLTVAYVVASAEAILHPGIDGGQGGVETGPVVTPFDGWLGKVGG